jgi:GTP-binding protein
MIVGINNRPVDLNVNPTKEKKKTNVRTTSTDESTKLAPITPMTLERAIDFIKDDEMIEVTPKSVRMRKTELNQIYRKSTLYYRATTNNKKN